MTTVMTGWETVIGLEVHCELFTETKLFCGCRNAFGDQPNQTPYEIEKAYWNREHPAAEFEDWWRKAVHDGIVPNSALAARPVTFKGSAAPPAKPAQAQGLEIVFRPDPFIFDGRFANNGWLQELPRPLTTLTWDNAAFVSPRTAERLGLQNEDLVELNYRGRKVKAPVWMVPGHADESVTVHLGYGRTSAGRVGNGVGFNAYALRTSDAPSFGSGLEIVKTGSKYPLAPTQFAHMMEGRAIVISSEIDEYRKNPGFAKEKAEAPPRGNLGSRRLSRAATGDRRPVAGGASRGWARGR